MRDSSLSPDHDESTARCPIPDWALRPLAILLPVLLLAAILWLIFR